MDVRGIDQVLVNSEVIEIGSYSIYYASPLSQAQLKAAAYMDRRDRGITHDVIDFVWMLRNYSETGHQARVFVDAWETIDAHTIEPWAWGAALLGQDLGSFSVELVEPVRATLAELQVPFSRAAEHVRPDRAPDGGERALTEVHELARAALLGLEASLRS